MIHIDKTASELAETFTAFELAKILIECKNVLERTYEACEWPYDGSSAPEKQRDKINAMISEANYE